MILKILNILYSIDNIELLNPFKNTLQTLAMGDPNLEIRNYAKKLFKVVE